MSELSRQVDGRSRRRRYFINRRMQLGPSAGPAIIGAAVTIALAVFCYVSVKHAMQSVCMRSHVRQSNTWDAARPIVYWGTATSFAALLAVGAGFSLAAAHKAASISREYLPLFEGIQCAEVRDLHAGAAAADAELASAYARFLRTYDPLVSHSRALSADIKSILSRIAPEDDARTEISAQIQEDLRMVLENARKLQESSVL